MEEHLKKLRNAIRDAPIDHNLVRSVENMIINNNAGTIYRFRSSTNAEDIEGFNGAGLYDSKTGILNDTIKTIEKAIRDVWAGTFTYRAFVERNLFNIYEPSVKMGILVHRAFPEEELNGVAITTNLYRNYFPGFIINIQKGEISVVAPGDSIMCDQFILYNTRDLGDRGDHMVADYITFSNQNNGAPLLNTSQLRQLYIALQEIKYSFYSEYRTFMSDYRSFALDIEFKWDHGQLYIKQARLF